MIDDDEAVRDSLHVLLEARGLDVRSYASADDFLRDMDLREAGCVIADIHMPGMNGLELQSKLQEKSPGLPMIIMTGNADVPSAVRALKSGALDFIEKPINTDHLLAAVQGALVNRQRTLEAETDVISAQSRIADLTPRERDVLRHLVAGSPNKIIAHELGISPRTVENHRAHLMLKMQVSSVAELVRLAISAGLSASGSGEA